MALAYPTAPSGRLIWLLDLALVAWTVTWIAVGALVGVRVSELKELSSMVRAAGAALEDAGGQLRSLGDVPFVGGPIGRVGQRLESTGREAVRSGRVADESIESLSRLLALSIALIPSVPLVALYAPLRVGRIREVRALRRALVEHGDDPMFREFLARRAVERLPYHVLRQVSENPWADIESGRHDHLAQAELARLGIRVRRPRAFAPPGRRVAN